VCVRYGWPGLRALVRREEARYDRVLNRQLLLDIPPRMALGLAVAVVLVTAGMAYALIGGWIAATVGLVVGLGIPPLVLRHLEQKRAARLEGQLVDAITTLASGVRAGLNLVQAMELLAKNGAPPVSQEFGQLLREYQMGLDLNQAMRNAANRIGSANYRLLFTAIEMHRRRGGNTGESLDRISESIREIQRLEGKLDALTAQGRIQAWMMAAMPVVFLAMLYGIDPEGVTLLFVEPVGRMILLLIVLLIAGAFVWIRRILAVNI
jgi:tight adherence protein B